MLVVVWEIFSKEHVTEMIVKGLPTLLIALVVPFISIRIALRQFYTQKWWEQKSSAYSYVIEQLSEYKHYQEILFEHYTNIYRYKEEYITECTEYRDKAFTKLKIASLKNQFILSDVASKVILQCVKNIEKENNENEDWQGAIDRQNGYASDCIKALKGISKKELKLH